MSKQQLITVGNAWGIQLEESMRPPTEQPEARSDGELMITFEAAEDAQALYDWVTGAQTGIELLKPGEVILTLSEQWGQYSLSFNETVLINKSDIVRAIINAYEDSIEESLVDSALDMLEEYQEDEAESLEEWSPYHDVKGQFATKGELAKAKKGSYSKGKRRNKVSGKTKKGLKLVATKLPCGRAARKVGKTTRCWDGKPGAWAGHALSRLAKKIRSKKNEVKWTDHDRVMLEKLSSLFAMRTEGKEKKFVIEKMKGSRKYWWTGDEWSDVDTDAEWYEKKEAILMAKKVGGEATFFE